MMSYRLAGVPGHALAASVFTSLGEFTGDAVRRLVRAWPSAQVVVCAGDLFAHNVLLRDQARRSLSGLRLPVLLP
jgi:Ser/Thr protein kinase RdoA (MazF antagonist)